jgi:thioredoxin 1
MRSHEALTGRSGLRHLKIEDGPGRALARAFRVKLWPTLVVLKDGKEVGRAVRQQNVQDIEDALAAAD